MAKTKSFRRTRQPTDYEIAKEVIKRAFAKYFSGDMKGSCIDLLEARRLDKNKDTNAHNMFTGKDDPCKK